MPTFVTPQPITASVEIVTGLVRIVATDRHDTVVEVSPRDPSRASDVRVADSARVDFRNGTLTVSAGRRFISLGGGGAVMIDIELPSGSRLQVSSASADLRADGAYGDCRFATASGNATIESVAGKVNADSASGAISVDALAGEATISTASGDATLGDLTADVRFRAASGSLSVRRLRGIVNAQTASGDVAVAAAVSGEVMVQSGSGDTHVGVEEGTAAKLDLRTHSGKVRNSLEPTDGPVEGEQTLRVRVKTGSGDIGVHRATATARSQ
jgi:putative adhesin